MSKILSYLCDKNICFYARKHDCIRQTKQDIYVREHDIDEDTFGDFDDAFSDDNEFNKIDFTGGFGEK